MKKLGLSQNVRLTIGTLPLASGRVVGVERDHERRPTGLLIRSGDKTVRISESVLLTAKVTVLEQHCN